MNDYDLLFGKNKIHIDNNLYFVQRTFEEIYNLSNIIGMDGYKAYQFIINSATYEPYVFKYQLEFSGIDYRDVTYIRHFLDNCVFENGRLNNNLCSFTIFMLNFMFDAEFIIKEFDIENYKHIYDKYGFYDNKTGGYLNRDNWYIFKNALEKMFFIKQPKEKFAKGKMAKKMEIRLMEKKAKELPDIDIYSIIDTLVWCFGNQYTYETILKLTPHQILRGFYKTSLGDNVTNVINGVYCGKLDAEILKEKSMNKFIKTDLSLN